MYPLCFTFRYLLFYMFYLGEFFHIQTLGSFGLCYHLHLGE